MKLSRAYAVASWIVAPLALGLTQCTPTASEDELGSWVRPRGETWPTGPGPTAAPTSPEPPPLPPSPPQPPPAPGSVAVQADPAPRCPPHGRLPVTGPRGEGIGWSYGVGCDGTLSRAFGPVVFSSSKEPLPSDRGPVVGAQMRQDEPPRLRFEPLHRAGAKPYDTVAAYVEFARAELAFLPVDRQPHTLADVASIRWRAWGDHPAQLVRDPSRGEDTGVPGLAAGGYVLSSAVDAEYTVFRPARPGAEETVFVAARAVDGLGLITTYRYLAAAPPQRWVAFAGERKDRGGGDAYELDWVFDAASGRFTELRYREAGTLLSRVRLEYAGGALAYVSWFHGDAAVADTRQQIDVSGSEVRAVIHEGAANHVFPETETRYLLDPATGRLREIREPLAGGGDEVTAFQQSDGLVGAVQDPSGVTASFVARPNGELVYEDGLGGKVQVAYPLTAEGEVGAIAGAVTTWDGAGAPRTVETVVQSTVAEDGAACRCASAPAPDAGADAGVAPEVTGLPCDVEDVLRRACASCHDGAHDEPSLVRYGDFFAASKVEEGRRVKDRLLARIDDASRPMPPAPQVLSPADRAVIAAWLEEGAPPRAGCAPTTGMVARGYAETRVVGSGGDLEQRRIHIGGQKPYLPDEVFPAAGSQVLASRVTYATVPGAARTAAMPPDPGTPYAGTVSVGPSANGASVTARTDVVVGSEICVDQEQDGDPLSGGVYCYQPGSNRPLRWTPNFGPPVRWSYGAGNRLASIDHGALGRTDFVYDALGNATLVVGNTGAEERSYRPGGDVLTKITWRRLDAAEPAQGSVIESVVYGYQAGRMRQVRFTNTAPGAAADLLTELDRDAHGHVTKARVVDLADLYFVEPLESGTTTYSR